MKSNRCWWLRDKFWAGIQIESLLVQVFFSCEAQAGEVDFQPFFTHVESWRRSAFVLIMQIRTIKTFFGGVSKVTRECCETHRTETKSDSILNDISFVFRRSDTVLGFTMRSPTRLAAKWETATGWGSSVLRRHTGHRSTWYARKSTARWSTKWWSRSQSTTSWSSSICPNGPRNSSSVAWRTLSTVAPWTRSWKVSVATFFCACHLIEHRGKRINSDPINHSTCFLWRNFCSQSAAD